MRPRNKRNYKEYARATVETDPSLRERATENRGTRTIRFSLKSNRFAAYVRSLPMIHYEVWADRKQRESNFPENLGAFETRDIALCSISLSQSVTGTVNRHENDDQHDVILTFYAGI